MRKRKGVGAIGQKRQMRRTEILLTQRSNRNAPGAGRSAPMMTCNLSDDMRRPRRGGNALPRRPTPCAGLFGWRKDGAPPRSRDDDPGKKPGPDYPAG